MRFAAAILLAGCSSLSSDPGLDAELQIAAAAPDATAQFNPGAMPGDGAGPKILSLNVSSFNVAPGAIAQPLLGTLDAGATAVAFVLDGDRGWWLLPAGVPDPNSPTMPSFAARMSFARTLAAGPVTLIGRAVDEHGHFGPATTLTLTILATAAPGGGLVVALSWASATDLDLHVVEPSGAEIWSDSPTSATGGVLSLDSNSGCVIDGQDGETASWAQPPSGHYQVRVDTFSLCGQAVADWRVAVTLDGASLGVASGQSIDADTRGPHQRGSGREALDFDVP